MIIYIHMRHCTLTKQSTTNLFCEHFVYFGLTYVWAATQLFYCDKLSGGLYSPLEYYTPSTSRYYCRGTLDNFASRVTLEISFLDKVFYLFQVFIGSSMLGHVCHWSEGSEGSIACNCDPVACEILAEGDASRL